MKQIEIYVCFLLWSVSTVLGLTIVNGRNATDGEVPFQVSIYNKENKFLCAGSILNEHWILSNAFCTMFCNNGSIHYNTLKVSKGDIVQIEKTIPYPGDHTFFKNDIGLIRTATPMQLGQPNANAAKLPKESDIPNDKDPLVVSGWGSLSDHSYPENLQIVNTTLLNQATCLKLIKLEFKKSQMLCSAPHKGPCFGDAGGPATVNGVLHGLVSFGGKDCYSQPSVYTRVAYYIPWIQKVTGIQIE